LNKGLRITLRVIGIIAALLICLWIFLWAYITYHKAGIIEKVKAEINQQINGKVDIENLATDFFHHFPNISISLGNVSIRDSLWSQHQHDFLKAEKIFIRLDFFSLFTGKPDISKITVENALIYFYTDTSGYSNLVKEKKSTEKKTGKDIPDLLLINTRFILEYPARNKLHDVDFKEIECVVKVNDSGYLLKINLNAMVHGLGFNTNRGSYLKEKNINGKFNLQITKTKAIKLDKIKLNIDNQPFVLSGFFLTEKDQPDFSLSISTKKIDFKKTIGLLTQTTQKKFRSFNVLQNIDISTVLSGSTAYKTIPFAVIGFAVKDVDIETPAGRFNNCSFTGDFTNEVDNTKPRLDENSMFTVKNFTGKWENIPLTANAIEVSNVNEPFLKCDVHSSFNLAGLNELTGSNSLQFMKGTGRMDIIYNGSLVNNDTVETNLNGNIRLKDAAIKYLPRQIVLKNMDGNFVFKNKDLLIEQLKAQAGTTLLNMSGSVRNIVDLIYKDPEKLTLEWNIATPYLDLVDFISFLGKKSALSPKKAVGNSRLFLTADKIDRMLEHGTANLKIQATRINFKKFTATNVTTSISSLQNEILLNSAKLNHAGGTIMLKGSLSDGASMNLIKLKSTISNVDIPSLFHAFNNFGQDAVTEQNMKGQLSADIILSGSLSDKVVIDNNSLISTINFSVVNGELNDFEPLQKVSETIFKKRDFSKVQFAELRNKLEIKGSAISFNKMEIRSSVFTLFAEGVYDTKKGTDISLQIPARNLKKIVAGDELNNKGRAGLNLRLRAKTGDDGKLKISWDPFRRAGNTNKGKDKMAGT